MMVEQEVKIEASKYYTPKEIIDLHPIFTKRGFYWLRTQLWNGKLKSVNTNPEARRHRYMVKGQDILDFLKLINE